MGLDGWSNITSFSNCLGVMCLGWDLNLHCLGIPSHLLPSHHSLEGVCRLAIEIVSGAYKFEDIFVCWQYTYCGLMDNFRGEVNMANAGSGMFQMVKYGVVSIK